MLKFAELYLHCNKTVTFRFKVDIITFLPLRFVTFFMLRRYKPILILLRNIFSYHDELVQNVLQRIVLESIYVLNL